MTADSGRQVGVPVIDPRRIVDARNVVMVDDATIQWITLVRHTNLIGRVMWALATPIHQKLIAHALHRANRSHRDQTPGLAPCGRS